MTNIRAVLVGIEKYASIRNAPLGPCKNTMQIANWLVDHGGTDPGNVHLFLSTASPLANGHGFAIGDAAYGTLNMFLRERLPKLLKAGELLFFYWAGHGITVPGGDRVLLYRDYSEALPTYALSLNEWQETLGDAARFEGREQLLFIDACANRVPELKPQPQQPRSGKWALADRYIICAVQEGDYAEVENEGGVFSRQLISYLQANSLRHAASFYADFKKTLNQANRKFFSAELRHAGEQLNLPSSLGALSSREIDRLVDTLRMKIKPGILEWTFKIGGMHSPQQQAQLYVDRELRRGLKGTSDAEPMRTVVEREKRFVLWGKPGAGKSTALYKVAFDCAAGTLFPDLVPAYLRLAYLKDESIEEALAELWGEPRWRDLLEQGRALILLDGLDEAQYSVSLDRFAEHYPTESRII